MLGGVVVRIHSVHVATELTNDCFCLRDGDAVLEAADDTVLVVVWIRETRGIPWHEGHPILRSPRESTKTWREDADDCVDTGVLRVHARVQRDRTAKDRRVHAEGSPPQQI